MENQCLYNTHIFYLLYCGYGILHNKEAPKIQVLTLSEYKPRSGTLLTPSWMPQSSIVCTLLKVLNTIHNRYYDSKCRGVTFSNRAYVLKPDDTVDILELLDNGVNADTSANDGVYTRYYTNVNLKGRYSVKCQVLNDGSAYEQLGFIGSPTPQLTGIGL